MQAIIEELYQQQEALEAELNGNYNNSYSFFNNDDAENSTCDSSYPPVNGFCRNENNDGAAMKPYKRLVPPAYCPRKDAFDRDDNPRCRIGYNLYHISFWKLR